MNLFLIVCRFAHFAAAMTLFGGGVFIAALAPARLRAVLFLAMRSAFVAASVVAAATAALWLLIEAGEMGGGWRDAIDPGVAAAVLADTGFGHVWQGRLVLAAALLAVALWRRAPPALLAVLAGLFLASLGLTGHAAMGSDRAGLFERANQAIHLLAGGFWLGALPPLLICLNRSGDPALKEEAGIALRRFSGLGHVAVAAVLATGVANIAMILGRPPTNLSSPYQAWLVAKIALVAIMVLLALDNRYRLAPRLWSRPEAERALRRNAAIEIVLGGAVLALVSAFATFEPM